MGRRTRRPDAAAPAAAEDPIAAFLARPLPSPQPYEPAAPLPTDQGPALEAAEQDFVAKARASNELSMPEQQASTEAVRLAEKIRGRPEPIPEEPTLGQEARVALTPHRMGVDARPLPAATEAAVQAAGFVGTESGVPSGLAEAGARAGATIGVGLTGGLLDVADALGIHTASTVHQWLRDQKVLPTEEGIPEETDLLAIMRILGTAIPATVIETVSRAPLPTKRRLAQNVDAASQAITNGQGLAVAANALFSVPPLSEQLGVPVGSNQRVRRAGPVADWLEGILERIERGEALEVDTATMARTAAGTAPLPLPGHPTPETVGWWLGLAADMVVDWESLVGTAPAAAMKVLRKYRAISELVPEATRLERLTRSITGHELEIGDWLADQAWRHVEQGGSIDDLPPRWRARIDGVALNEHGMTADELAQAEGFGRRGAPAEKSIEAPEQLTAAEQAAIGGRIQTYVDPNTGEVTYLPFRIRKRTHVPATAKKRPILPPFRHDAATAADWWEAASESYRPGTYPRGGYNQPRHLGWERIEGHLDQLPDEPKYVLLNKDRDVIKTDTYYGAVHAMLDRAKKAGSFIGDEIWYGVVRPVARWGADERGRITVRSDYLFASPAERRVIQLARQSDPRAYPVRLQQLADEAAKVAAEKASKKRAGKVLVSQVLQSPAPAAEPPLIFKSVVQKAAELEARDLLGSHELRMLPGGALVSRDDWDQIIGDAQKIMGLSPERLKALVHRGPLEVVPATLTGKEFATVADLGRRAGLPADAIRLDQPLTVPTVIQLHRQAVKEAGGVLSEVRYRVRGMPLFHEQLLSSLKLATQNRTKWTKMGRLISSPYSPVRAISRMFFEDPLEGVAPRLKTKLKEISVRLERNADDALGEFLAQGKDMSPSQRMLHIAGRYSQVTPGEVDLAARVRTNTTAHTQARAQEELAKLAGTVVDPEARAAAHTAAQLQLRPDLVRNWPGMLPRWVTAADNGVFIQGLEAWSRRVLQDAAESGRRWLESAVMATGEHQHFGQSVLRERLQKGVADEVALRIYDEVFRRGALDGVATREGLAAADYPKVPIKTDEALILHVLNLRQEKILTEAMDDLLYHGLVVRQGDPRRSALNAAMLGEDRRYNHVTKQWEFRFSEGQTAWANNQLADWGFDPGAQGGSLVDKRIGRRDVIVPAELGAQIDKLVSRGLIDSRQITPGVPAYNTLIKAFKEWTTHGLLLPNPSYFTGQMLSIAPTLLTTQGLIDTVRTANTALRHPVVVGELMRRMHSDHPSFPAKFLQPVLMTEAGFPVDIDAMAEVAKRMGLADTSTSFETNRQFANVVMRDGADYQYLDPRKVRYLPQTAATVRKGLGNWQQLIRDFAGSFDQASRMGVYVEQVRRGVPMEEAAIAARAAQLDFRALTDWESKNMRFVFTFYAYLRKNADAHITALFSHPARVLGQIRLAHAGVTQPWATVLNPVEQGAIDEQDLARMIIHETDGVYSPNGRVNPMYRTNRLQSSPVAVPEFLMAFRMMGLIGMLPGYHRDPQPLLGSLSPTLQIPAILLLGVLPGRSAGILDRPASNRIPPVLMHMFGVSDMARWAFGAGPVPLGGDEDPSLQDPEATAELGAGQLGAYSAGAVGTEDEGKFARATWQAFRAFVGRPLGNLQDLSVLAGINDPPPDVSWGQFATAYMLGLSWRPRANEAAAKEAAQKRTIREFEQTGQRFNLPDRSGDLR